MVGVPNVNLQATTGVASAAANQLGSLTRPCASLPESAASLSGEWFGLLPASDSLPQMLAVPSTRSLSPSAMCDSVSVQALEFSTKLNI